MRYEREESLFFIPSARRKPMATSHDMAEAFGVLAFLFDH
jgi:hypothetical protein